MKLSESTDEKLEQKKETGPSSPPISEEIELLNIPINDIIFENRARKRYTDLQTLAAKFKEKGVIQPVAVERLEDGKFRLLAGGRRWSAAQFAGLETLPARIYPTGLSNLERREIELMENLDRQNLHHEEEAWLVTEIDNLQKEKHGTAVGPSEGHSSSDTAEMLKVTPATVSRKKKLAAGLKKFGDRLQGQTKNENEAIRLLGKLERQDEEAIIDKRYKEELKTDTGDVVKKRFANAYILGDFFDHVRDLPANNVNIVEIDPPYGIDLKKNKHKSAATNQVKHSLETYTEIEEDKYPEFLKTLFQECYRVMFPASWMICWCGPRWMSTVIEKMGEAGLEVCPIPAIWAKTGTTGQTNQPEKRLGNSYEMFIYGRKGDAPIRIPGKPNLFHARTVFSDHKIHPTERPINLLEDILSIFTTPGGIVMVPFLGSGNTLLACANKGYKGYGFELSEEFRPGFLKRLDDSKIGEYRSYENQGHGMLT